MKPFGQWFADFGKPVPAEPASSDDLTIGIVIPDGVDEMLDGTFTAICVGCGQRGKIWCDISEIPLTGYEHYCGSGVNSPSCCP